MGVFLVNFVIFTMSIIGVISLILVIFKKSMINANFNKTNSTLKIEESININPRKSLYVVKAGKEKFLIASDAERTTFLSKLEADTNLKVSSEAKEQNNTITFPTGMKTAKKQPMKELLKKWNLSGV